LHLELSRPDKAFQVAPLGPKLGMLNPAGVYWKVKMANRDQQDFFSQVTG